MSRVMSLFALASLAGCIIYEKDVIHHGPHDCPGCGWYDTGDSGDTGGAEPVETAWTLNPGEIQVGTTEILSLTSLPASDYGAIASLEFYGALTVCTTSVRDDELLVTLSADASAIVG